MVGKLLIAENLRDALWAFEFLARNPKVDPGRIGCVGLSYGGRMTMLTAALEKRIRVAVISGALNSPDLLRVDRFIGAHKWNGVEAYPLLKTH